MHSVEQGIILIWSGAVVDIPAGWGLCDGTQDTPDLRDRFVVGAGATYAPGASGGTNTHQHFFTSSGHTHNIGAGVGIGAGTEVDDTTDSANDTGATDFVNHRPPYYALAYIQKL